MSFSFLFCLDTTLLLLLLLRMFTLIVAIYPKMLVTGSSKNLKHPLPVPVGHTKRLLLKICLPLK